MGSFTHGPNGATGMVPHFAGKAGFDLVGSVAVLQDF